MNKNWTIFKKQIIICKIPTVSIRIQQHVESVLIVCLQVQVGTPSEGQLRRGDIIRKIEDYDARDLRHEDAQNLFTKAGNQISLVVQRYNIV